MDPLISVLMITYNHERYIEAAIESVLNQQTDYPFELVIGEDHSTDATLQIIQGCMSKKPGIIKLVRGDSNVGVTQNFYNTFAACTGKYLAILDGDDWWTDPLKLQKQVSFMEADPEFGFVHSDVNHYYEDSGKTDLRINRTNGVLVPNGNLFAELIKPKPLFIKTATVCFRKELAKAFNFHLSISENWPLLDLPLWMDITFHTKAHYFDEVFATYRLLNESASRTTLPEKKYKYHKALHHIRQLYFAKYQVDDAAKKKMEEVYYRGLIRIAYTMGDSQVAEEAQNALARQQASIGMKERILILATRHSWLKRLILFIK